VLQALLFSCSVRLRSSRVAARLLHTYLLLRMSEQTAATMENALSLLMGPQLLQGDAVLETFSLLSRQKRRADERTRTAVTSYDEAVSLFRTAYTTGLCRGSIPWRARAIMPGLLIALLILLQTCDFSSRGSGLRTHTVRILCTKTCVLHANNEPTTFGTTIRKRRFWFVLVC
jgi:hypothetical protein